MIASSQLVRLSSYCSSGGSGVRLGSSPTCTKMVALGRSLGCLSLSVPICGRKTTAVPAVTVGPWGRLTTVTHTKLEIGSGRTCAAAVPLNGQHGGARSEGTAGTGQAEAGTRDGGARRVRRTEAGEEGDGEGEEGWGWAGSTAVWVPRSRAGGSGGIGKTGHGASPGDRALGWVISGHLLGALGWAHGSGETQDWGWLGLRTWTHDKGKAAHMLDGWGQGREELEPPLRAGREGNWAAQKVLRLGAWGWVWGEP